MQLVRFVTLSPSHPKFKKKSYSFSTPNSLKQTRISYKKKIYTYIKRRNLVQYNRHRVYIYSPVSKKTLDHCGAAVFRLHDKPS